MLRVALTLFAPLLLLLTAHTPAHACSKTAKPIKSAPVIKTESWEAVLVHKRTIRRDGDFVLSRWAVRVLYDERKGQVWSVEMWHIDPKKRDAYLKKHPERRTKCLDPLSDPEGLQKGFVYTFTVVGTFNHGTRPSVRSVSGGSPLDGTSAF